MRIISKACLFGLFSSIMAFCQSSSAISQSMSFEICKHHGDPIHIIDSCTQVIEHFRDKNILIRAHNQRGLALCKLDRCAEAIIDFDEVIRLDSSIAGYYDNRAKALRAANRFDEAIKDSLHAVRMAPTYAFTYIGEAIGLEDEKRFSGALWVLSKAEAIDPTNAGIVDLRGKLLGEAGRFDEAYAAYDQELRLQPNSPNVYRTRASTEELQGKIEGALSDLKRYPADAPASRDVAAQIERLERLLFKGHGRARERQAGTASTPGACEFVSAAQERLDCYDKLSGTHNQTESAYSPATPSPKDSEDTSLKLPQEPSAVTDVGGTPSAKADCTATNCLPGEQPGDFPDPPKGMYLYDTTSDSDSCIAARKALPRQRTDYASFMCVYANKNQNGIFQNAVDKCQNVVPQIWCSLQDCEKDLQQKGLTDHINRDHVIKTVFFCASRSNGGPWSRAN